MLSTQLRNRLLLNMTETHLVTSRTRLQTSSSQHMSSSRPAVELMDIKDIMPMEIDQINGFNDKKGMKGKKGKQGKNGKKGKKGQKANRGKDPAVGSGSEPAERLSAKSVSHSEEAAFKKRQGAKDPVQRKVLWKGPVYQLDATDSEQPRMPLEPGTIMMDQSATQQSQSSGQVSGLWSPGPIIAKIIGVIMDIHNRVTEESCRKIITQSDVKRCGQKRSLMYDTVLMSQWRHYHLHLMCHCSQSQEIRSFNQSLMLRSSFMASRSAPSFQKHWPQSQLHHRGCVMPNHWQLNDGGESVLVV
eukprot:4452961-Amphidinium_carterae.6